MARPPGVMCLEGEWDDNMQSRTSVEPALRLLEQCGVVRLIHRDVATREELEYYLARWAALSAEQYPLLCLDFHGSTATLSLGKGDITLDEIAVILKGRCDGKKLFLGACRTMAAPADQLQRFCRDTELRCVVGFTKNVEWVDSAVFEIAAVDYLLKYAYTKPLYNGLERDYPGLSRRLGLRVSSATWTSDRSQAEAALER